MPAYVVEHNGNAHEFQNGNAVSQSHVNGNGVDAKAWEHGTIVFGSRPITIEDVEKISRREASVKLSHDSKFVERIKRGQIVLQKLIKDNHIIYGVSTGFGNNCTVNISKELMADLPEHLVSYHCVGMGENFNEEQTRALLTARLVSLTKGFSAVRLELLEQLVTLIQNDILPCVPQEGSVGASGDLTPLSYVAAVLCGQRQVMFEGQIQPTEDVFKKLNITPLRLMPKEGLALMNGTSVMTGVACLAFQRAQFLAKLCTRMTSLAVISMKGNIFHYDATLFSVKEHPGQQLVAKRMRQDFLMSDAPQDYSKHARLQDRYSLRCAPHIIGVLEDSLPFFRKIIETELNSANDNPIIDAETERVFHGGMFYGGHIAFVMDGMKTLVANLADLMDRQMALLVDTNYNNGLPANLSGVTGERAAINHGLKALQISMSAWTAEALKLTMPASVFSRSTESHNQDKVSMGTIAARDCIRVIQLTEQVAAGLLVAVRQAMTLRKKINPELQIIVSPETDEFIDFMDKRIEFVTDNAPIEPILRSIIEIFKQGDIKLYDEDLESTTDLEKYYRYTKVGDYTIRYVKIGNGPECIFGFPGLLGSVKVGYEKLIEYFAKDSNKYTFYSWDMPGYFGSQPASRKSEDITFDKEVELCYEFLRSMGHSSYTVMGWSAGSQLAILLAMKHPEIVKRIFIWGAWDRLEGKDLETHVWFRDLKNLEPKFLAETVQDNGQGYDGYERNWHSWMDFVKKTYSGDYDQGEWVKRFDGINCPTTVLWGDRDNIVTLHQAEQLVKHIKNAKLEKVPKAPHWIQTIFPSVLYNKLVEFINSN